MKTILVDDMLLDLQLFELKCADMPDFEIVGKFTDPNEAIEYASGHVVDFALLDIDMPGMNGIELASGSIRITNPELQSRIFKLLGLSDEEAYAKFGYLLDAFRYGAPPHGGMGIGLDRLVMQMLGCDSLRDVVAYPKVQNASEPMTGCPAEVDDLQLDELGIKLKTE